MALLDTRYAERHLNLCLSDPDIRGFKEFAQRRGIDAAYHETVRAMEEYKNNEVRQEELRGEQKAKQVAIAFAEWINEEGYWQHECGWWYKEKTGEPGIHTNKLFELFLSTQ